MLSLNNSFIPVISPILSILFFFGLHFLGFLIVKILKIENYIKSISDINYQFSLIGIIFVSFFLYPIVVNNLFNILLLKILSSIIILFGIFFISKKIKKNFFNAVKFEIELYIIFLILTLYLLLAISPITSADSLDYHIGVPYYILNNEIYPNLKFWMHFTKSGAGEIFYTLPLSNYAINLPGLTQISGILSIIGILLKQNNFSSNKINYNLILIFLSCPVLIFFVASAKPQLIYVAVSTLVFTLIFFGDKKQFKNNKFLLFISILLIINTVGKFSFSLSSGLLFLACLYLSSKEKNKLNFILIICFVSLVILLSKSNFLIKTYDTNFFNSLFSPLPLHLPGYKQLYVSLTSCGYSGCFPYWLVFPKDINSFTESLGIGGIIFLFIKARKNQHFYLAISILFIQIITSSFFGPNNARWYLEPFVWSIILIKYFGFNFEYFKKVFFVLSKVQSLLIIAVLFYSVFSLTGGSFSEKYYQKIMKLNADGFDLMDWSNSVLNKDDILISTHRSFALSDIKTIPGDLFVYMNFTNDKNSIYLQELKKLKPNFILFYDDKKNFDKFKKCLGKLVYYQKNVAKKSTRNPFNRVENFYDGYIYEFKYSQLPKCILQ